MSRKPYSRLFWDDLRSEPTLRLCSRAARSFWVDMLGLMHKAGGRLIIAGVRPTPRQLAQVLGDDETDVRTWLAELETAAVFSVDAEGVIYSRRMVRDFERDEEDKQRGRRGGNPALLNGAASAEEVLTNAAREAMKRAADAERQRRRREKRKAESVTPERDMSRLSTVTRHVTSRVTERDAKRDRPNGPASAPKAAGQCHGVNPPLKDHSHSHSHIKPYSETPEPRAGGPASPVTGAGPPGPRRTKPPDNRTPEQRAADRAAARAAAEEAFTLTRKPGDPIQ